MTQRTANPCTPVRFRLVPPLNEVVNGYSSIAQLVEQAAVNRFVAGSSPARGAIQLDRHVKVFIPGRHKPVFLCLKFLLLFLFWLCLRCLFLFALNQSLCNV